MKKFEVTILLLVGLIPLLWYKPGYIALGHDMGFPLAPVDHFLDRLYTWTDRLGPFGSNAVQVLPGVFIHGLEALLFSVGFPLVAVQKLTFSFWFVLPGLTMYTLLHYLHPNKDDYPVRLSGSLFYMMNHFLLQAWVIAERTKFSIVAALPLVVLLIIKVFHAKESLVKNSILFAMTLFFLNGGEGIPLFLCLILVVAIAAIVFSFLSRERLWPKLKRLFVFTLLSSVFWILLSSYWLYPYLKSYGQTFGQRFDTAGGISGAISWSQGISAHASWINLFKLRGISEWYTNPDHPFANEFFTNPMLLFINILLPSLAIVSLIRLKSLPSLEFKTRIFFLLLLLIAVPLSAGSHTPLGILYEYLMVNVPGFVLFRSAFFKFGMLIWFAYAYLIAVGVKDISDWLKNKKILVPLFLTAYVVLLFVYNYPLLTGSFFAYAKGKSVMVKVPDYIFAAKQELDANKFSTRTLLLPNADIRTEYIEYDWGYFSLNELTDILGRKSTVTNAVAARTNEKSIIVGILSEFIKFGSSNLIKYIGADRAIIRHDFISPDYEGNVLSGITESISKSKDFTLKKSLGRWDVYSYNADPLPQIYSPSAITFVSAEPDDLAIAANLPEALSNSAFVWSNYPKDALKEDTFNKLIIQARCADCPPANSYQIYFSTSKVLIPGQPLYQLGKLVTEARKYLAKSPHAKLEINLATSTTLISDLGALQAKPHEQGIGVATQDLIQNLVELQSNLTAISDPVAKRELLAKVRFYASYYLVYEAQWATSAQPGLIKDSLKALELELTKFIADIDSQIGQPKSADNPQVYSYRLDPAQAGDYSLYVYNPNSTRSDIVIRLNGRTYIARKLAANWYKSTSLPLGDASVIIEVSKSSTASRPTLFAELETISLGFIPPTIEFVALNQTKYLVKTTGSNNFVLGFNSRFDPNWSLREVDQPATAYFKGDTKSYQSGQVTEYARQDTHVLTDLVFTQHGAKLYPTLELNGISSGWVVKQQNYTQAAHHFYLLEYNNQNDFYQAAAVSMITLVLVSGLLILKYAKNT